jgi:hypothetical protein
MYTISPGVLDHRGKIRVLTRVAVRKPERGTHPSTSSVRQVDRERNAVCSVSHGSLAESLFT